MSIVIVGAGGHGREIWNLLTPARFGFIKGFLVEDEFLEFARNRSSGDLKVLGYRVHSFAELVADPDAGNLTFVVAVGNPELRRRLRDRILEEFPGAFFPSVWHEHVSLDHYHDLGAGSQLLARVVVGNKAQVGAHAVVNHGAVLCHDAVLGDFATVGPNATLCGGAKALEGARVGAGAVVLPGVTVGAWAVLGAGAVATKDIPDRQVWVGVPARRVPDGVYPGGVPTA